MCRGWTVLLYRYLSWSPRQLGNVERQGQLFFTHCLLSILQQKMYFSPGARGAEVWGAQGSCASSGLGVSSPEGAHPWAAPSDPSAEHILAGLEQGHPKIPSKASWHQFPKPLNCSVRCYSASSYSDVRYDTQKNKNQPKTVYTWNSN